MTEKEISLKEHLTDHVGMRIMQDGEPNQLTCRWCGKKVDEIDYEKEWEMLKNDERKNRL